MRVIYLAAPFRALTPWRIAENVRRAERLALSVWKLGAACLCPHGNTQHFQGECPDQVWLDGDLELMGRCDAVLMGEGWEDSIGAMWEREVALKGGMPVFANLDDLAAWLGEEDER